MGARYATERRLALGLAVSLAYVAVADPHDPAAAMPRCPVKLVSGWDCPSCGGLRVVHDLLRGDVRRALADNLFLVLASPVLLYLLCRHARALHAGQRYEVPRGLALGLLVTAGTWGVVRNLPGWRWKPTVL